MELQPGLRSRTHLALKHILWICNPATFSTVKQRTNRSEIPIDGVLSFIRKLRRINDLLGFSYSKIFTWFGSLATYSHDYALGRVSP